MKDCDICCGSKNVRLPVVRRLTMVDDSYLKAPAAVETWREFPCPQCGSRVDETRIAFVTDVFPVVSDGPEHEAAYQDHIRRTAALGLADRILRAGFISFEKCKFDDTRMSYHMRATVGVVAPDVVASMEERITSRQMEVAKDMAEDIKLGVGAWGSYYGNQNVTKGVVYDVVNEAFVRASTKKVRR